jgi:cation-transporting P-type ATPase 13A2
MVIRTGFSTTKGELVRSILYSKPIEFKFYSDSFKFIGVLFVLSMSRIVTTYSISCYHWQTTDVLLLQPHSHGCFHCIELPLPAARLLVRQPASQGTRSVHDRHPSGIADCADGRRGICCRSIIEATDIMHCSIAVWLLLLLSLSLSLHIFRAHSLRLTHQAPCERRVNLAGLLDIMCFDKTGTLTQDGLDVLGVREVQLDEANGVATWKHQSTDSGASGDALLRVLTCCHSLAVLGSRVIGDNLEVKMFESTGAWKVIEQDVLSPFMRDGISSIIVPPHVPSNASFEQQKSHGIAIVKRFEFTSELQRMSCICLDLASGEMFIVIKGAPEAIVQLCDRSSGKCYIGRAATCRWLLATLTLYSRRCL